MGNGTVEREINLWDMFWAVCLKWRSILACAVIFTVLAGGFSYYQSIKMIETAQAEVDIEDIKDGMSEREKKAIDLYYDYMQMYDEQLKYNENAAIMCLDANGFYKGEITYYIDNFFVAEYPIIERNNNIVAMINSYTTLLRDKEFENKVKETLNVTDDNSYVMELIDCANVYGGTNVINSDAKDGVFTISVYGEDEKKCNELKELVKTQIANNKSKIEKKFGKHDVKILQDICRYTSDGTLLNDQKLNMDMLKYCSINMSDISLNFTDAQALYVQLLEEQEHLNGSLENSNVEYAVDPKMFILGFLGGAFLMIAYWIVVYIFSNGIRLEDDFEYLFKKKLLGNIPIERKEKKKWFAILDCLITKARHFNKRYFEEDDAYDMVVANIRIALQKLEYKTIVMTGAVCSESERKVIDRIAENLKKDGVEVVVTNPILYDAESLEKLVKIGQVVFVEKSDESLYQEVQKEIEICEQQEITLLGCVVVY